METNTYLIEGIYWSDCYTHPDKCNKLCKILSHINKKIKYSRL